MCLVSGMDDAAGTGDEVAIAAQLLLSLDDFTEFILDVPSFSALSDRTRRYLPVVHDTLTEARELQLIAEKENMRKEIVRPTITPVTLFKYWCMAFVPRPKQRCSRYVQRLQPGGDEGQEAQWSAIVVHLSPAAAFLQQLFEVWSIRIGRQRASGRFDPDLAFLARQAGHEIGTAPPSVAGQLPPLRVVVNGGGPAGLINAATAYASGAAVVLLEQRGAAPARDVWFDLTSSRHILHRWEISSPTQDLLAAFGWAAQTTRATRSAKAGILHASCADLQVMRASNAVTM